MKYFVYYSATGNGDFIADQLKEKGYQPVKVETVKPLGKMGIFKMIRYGGKAMMGRKAKIKEVNLDLKEDDEVVIGSPIWNDRLSTPINAVLAKFDFNKETTQFVLYPAGSAAKKAMKQLNKRGFKKSPIVYIWPLKNPNKAQEALADL